MTEKRYLKKDSSKEPDTDKYRYNIVFSFGKKQENEPTRYYTQKFSKRFVACFYESNKSDLHLWYGGDNKEELINKIESDYPKIDGKKLFFVGFGAYQRTVTRKKPTDIKEKLLQNPDISEEAEKPLTETDSPKTHARRNLQKYHKQNQVLKFLLPKEKVKKMSAKQRRSIPRSLEKCLLNIVEALRDSISYDEFFKMVLPIPQLMPVLEKNISPERMNKTLSDSEEASDSHFKEISVALPVSGIIPISDKNIEEQTLKPQTRLSPFPKDLWNKIKQKEKLSCLPKDSQILFDSEIVPIARKTKSLTVQEAVEYLSLHNTSKNIASPRFWHRARFTPAEQKAFKFFTKSDQIEGIDERFAEPFPIEDDSKRTKNIDVIANLRSLLDDNSSYPDNDKTANKKGVPIKDWFERVNADPATKKILSNENLLGRTDFIPKKENKTCFIYAKGYAEPQKDYCGWGFVACLGNGTQYQKGGIYPAKESLFATKYLADYLSILYALDFAISNNDEQVNLFCENEGILTLRTDIKDFDMEMFFRYMRYMGDKIAELKHRNKAVNIKAVSSQKSLMSKWEIETAVRVAEKEFRFFDAVSPHTRDISHE